MLVIFGLGHRTKKEFAEHKPTACAHCNNTKPWKLGREAYWFTLFFIPVFPVKIEYWRICPICRKGHRLNYHQFEERIKLASNKHLNR